MRMQCTKKASGPGIGRAARLVVFAGRTVGLLGLEKPLALSY